VVATVLLATAGTGQARSRHGGKVEVQRASTVGFLDLGRAGGYRIALSMPSERVVTFVAFRAQRRKEAVTYHVYATHNRGPLGRGVVRARFGSLGRVSLRFRPSGRVRREGPPSGCEGGSSTIEFGSFVGHLRFRSKGDYFHASSAKGAAAIAHLPRLKCEKGRALEPNPRSLRKYVGTAPVFSDREGIALLYASARRHGRYVGITATHDEGTPPGANVQLQVIEARKGMAIGHGISLAGGKGTLLTSLPGAHPATATLAPPAPFYGKAAYSEESQSWTGTLGVKLAGLRLPLTGPGFHVHLCVTNPLKDRDGCEFFKAEPPPVERPARLAWMLR
jgi:hypothetical protein